MVLLVAVVTISVTAAYALRLWMLTWGGGARDDAPDDVREARDRSVLLIGPLVLLALGWARQSAFLREFRELAQRCTALAPRVAAVLEGGYELDTLPGLVQAALEGFES